MSSNASGNLITRIYSNFRGVDFTKSNNTLVRSPDSINMWKNYRNELGKNIETRPGLELFKQLTGIVYGIYFYNKERRGLFLHMLGAHGEHGPHMVVVQRIINGLSFPAEFDQLGLL